MQKQVKVLRTQQYYQPKTVDAGMLMFLYQTSIGRLLLRTFLVKKWFSKFYAVYYHSRLSVPGISSFIKEHSIDMGIYEPARFRSFNDFFIRSFKSGQRPFETGKGILPAFCEAFYMAWQTVGQYQSTDVKGQPYSIAQLFQNEKNAAPFIDGPLIIARLAPYHYHWFHYLDDGEIIDQYHIPGQLHSVDPMAIASKPNILFTNKRDITILQTVNFGKIAYIEVGALTVGDIVQLHKVGDRVARAEKKGYFSFGGSTVLILGEKGMWTPDAEILENTQNDVESAVLLGREIALAHGKQ